MVAGIPNEAQRDPSFIKGMIDGTDMILDEISSFMLLIGVAIYVVVEIISRITGSSSSLRNQCRK